MCIVYVIVLIIALPFLGGFMEIFGDILFKKETIQTILAIAAIIFIGWLVSSFWYIIVPAAVVVVITGSVVWMRKEKAECEKEEEKERYLISRINVKGFWSFIYKGKLIASRRETDMILDEITNHYIFIDTNIWMDSEIDCFWHDLYLQCSAKKRQIIIPSAVYDEIIKLKKDDNQDKAFKARLAFNRIMKFSNSDLLFIHDIKKVSNPYPYADSVIIDMCEYMQYKTNQEMFSLITNDNDLIIRTRHILNQYKMEGEIERCKILSVGKTAYTDKWKKYKDFLSNDNQGDAEMHEQESKKIGTGE